MTDHRLETAVQLQARMRQTDRSTILYDELRKRRNRRLRELYGDDPERWSLRNLARALGLSEGTLYTAVKR